MLMHGRDKYVRTYITDVKGTPTVRTVYAHRINPKPQTEC